jgi:hypothetical protein
VNEAAKNIVMMDLAILQAEAAAGMYKKPLDVLAREIHYRRPAGGTQGRRNLFLGTARQLSRLRWLLLCRTPL